MASEFDPIEAKKFLKEREENTRKDQEKIREEFLWNVISILREHFKDSAVQVYIVGSLIRPNQFTSSSDVDIVVKNFTGDRFALWSALEAKIGRTVEVILFETCQFKEFIESDGLRVM